MIRKSILTGAILCLLAAAVAASEKPPKHPVNAAGALESLNKLTTEVAPLHRACILHSSAGYSGAVNLTIELQRECIQYKPHCAK